MVHLLLSWKIVLVTLLAIAGLGFLLAYKKAQFKDNASSYKIAASYYGWWVFLTIFGISVFLYLVSILGANYLSSYKLENTITAQILSNSVSAHLSRDQEEIIDNKCGTIREILHQPKLLDQFLSDNHGKKLSYDMVSDYYSKNNINLPLDGDDSLLKKAIEVHSEKSICHIYIALGAIFIAILVLYICLRCIVPSFKAQSKIESIIAYILQASATIAILITIGIVFSLIFQTISFFKQVPITHFLFGTVWDPRFADAGDSNSVGQFGLLPLLLGTLYIALIAMLVAVPIGLLAATYMSEYANTKIRSIIKPMIELLAGIPTIVYGFFALSVVGPFFRDFSALIGGGQPFILSQSVLTAGFVIGVMLIPFVSSLTDDVLNAVPKSLRDGSYGLGATKSETIKKVVWPAALPGIVGALLLAASRAIGETMIVVLAAGVSANLDPNPFHAMTTITVKIVSQLTGDLEFNSPQTLVAFALGMTLFILTLLMNVFALYIVRKYREQYE